LFEREKKKNSEGKVKATSSTKSEDLESHDRKDGEYEIPEKADDIEVILDELEAEDSKSKSSRKKQAKSRGRGKRARSKKPSEEELLSRIEEKSRVLFELNKKITSLEQEAKVNRDKWLRTLAEFENYRKRSHKEWELLQHKAKADVICGILSIVDDFERAFSVVEGKDDDFVEGIRMIYKNLLQILMKLGVEVIEAHDRLFDPKYHMAVGQIKSKGKKSGHVVEVTQKGYLLNDAVIRPAKVIIAK